MNATLNAYERNVRGRETGRGQAAREDIDPPTMSCVGHCRFCGTALRHRFVDLGLSPLCQAHIEPDRLNAMEPFYPLDAWVCHECFLVQLNQCVSPDRIFSEYAYFSSYSDSWVAHARRYAERMRERFDLDSDALAVEIASNDGYLLQHFVAAGIPVRGIEPAANVARVAIERGIPTTMEFFGEATARDFAQQYGQPDLLLGNNVLAHVPDINDFVAGMRALLAPTGVVTMEFPHLLRLIEHNQFDTVYHEHFSNLSFGTVERIFAAHGLVLFDVEELDTHGGSLRIYARHAENESLAAGASVDDLRERERRFGLTRMPTYRGFDERVKALKRDLLTFLIEARRAGKRIAGYGAPGKGNTLLNYCGIRTDLIEFTVDRSPHKQGRFTPGTRIPIRAPEAIGEARPDYVVILPWNLCDEIQGQLRHIREWGGQCVSPIPEVRVLPWPADRANP